MADSSCVIALERIGRLDVLLGSFTSVLIPPAVAAEIGTPVPGLKVAPVRIPGIAALKRSQIGAGETEAISLGLQVGDAVVILDDLVARRIAHQLGLRVIGTLGVLLRAKRQGLITEVGPTLAALEKAGFRMTPKIRQEVLRLAGERPPPSRGAAGLPANPSE